MDPSRKANYDDQLRDELGDLGLVDAAATNSLATGESDGGETFTFLANEGPAISVGGATTRHFKAITTRSS